MAETSQIINVPRDTTMQASNTQLAAIVTKLQAICDALGLSSPLIADDFDPAVSYSPGDYCIKDGTLYRCNTATTADAPWDITEWTATSVTQEFIRLQAILGDEDISAIGDGTVTGAITTLNSTLANVSETLIDNTAKIYYKVKNGIVRLRFAGGTVDLTSGSWVTYGSLPNGVRRPDETEYASVTCGSNGKYTGIVMLSPAGTISYYCNYTWGGDASIKSIWGELVY